MSRSKNNKEIFDVLPILHTGLDEYLVPSICNLVSNLKDKLCWLLKDEFNKKSSSKNIFVVKFGEIFENYVFEILIKQYGKANVNKIPRVKDEKSADFIISSKNYLFIIEKAGGEECLVPVADEFISLLDPANKRIEFSLPEGLLEL